MSRRAGLGLAQGFMQGYDFMDRVDKRERRMGLAEASSNRADERQSWGAERMDAWRDDNQRLDDARLVTAMNEGVQSGQINPQIAQEFGKRFDVDWSNYVDPEFGNSLSVLEGTVKGEHSMQSPEFNRAFERVFRTEINKGTGEEYEGADGAHRLEQKRLNRVYPGPDGKSLMVDLDVLDRGPNGEEWRRAPVTVNRSAKDDEVRAIPLEAALRKLKGHQIMYESVQASPELQAVIQQYAARTGAQLPKSQTSDAWRKAQELQKLGLDPEAARNNAYGLKPQANEQYGQPFQHPKLGWVQPGPNGKLTQMTPPKSGDGQYGELFEHPQLGWGQTGPDGKFHPAQGNGGTKAPADVQTAEWLVAKGIAEDDTAAWNMLSMARSDPSRFVSSYVTQAMKAQEMMMPEEQKTQQELVDEGTKMYQHIMSSARGGQDQEPAPAQPAGLEMTGSQVQALPEDGSAVQQADGSYSGKVNRSAGLNIQSKAEPNPRTHVAPPEAVKYLQQNPQFAADFKAKYGYLPEGF